METYLLKHPLNSADCVNAALTMMRWSDGELLKTEPVTLSLHLSVMVLAR